jgi:hypothetical protein
MDDSKKEHVTRDVDDINDKDREEEEGEVFSDQEKICQTY